MIKNLSQIHVKVDNKDFYLLCDNDSTFPQVKESLFQFQKYIGAIEDELKAKQALTEDKNKVLDAPEVNIDDKPPEVVD